MVFSIARPQPWASICQTAQKAGTCAVHDTMALDQVPERFRPLKEEWQAEEDGKDPL